MFPPRVRRHLTPPLPPCRRGLGVALLAVAGVSAGCGAETSEDAETLQASVVAAHPWDPTSFTQGVEAVGVNEILVGTGHYGESRVYYTTLAGEQRDSRELPAEYFGEGVTRAGDTIWQLTWKAGIALKRNAGTLEQVGEARYDGEGWGLCAQKDRLVMSDGSGRLTFRDPETFAATGGVDVTKGGEATTMLNELECASDGMVWANKWQTDEIYRIDPETGEVTGVLDTTGMFPAAQRPGADVLNGIAEVPESKGRRFYLTGKWWEEMYEVEVGPALGSGT